MTQSISEMLKSGVRTSHGKTIHLKEFLPSYMEQGEIADFIDFFEVFLNQLYYNDVSARGTNDDFDVDANGIHTYYRTSATSDGDLVTSADPSFGGTSGVAVRYPITSADTVSILEQAKRIAELHDPDLIDINYIQRLANLMGYSVAFDKPGISNLTFGFNATTQTDIDNYLRFVISNLPNWYKIKTTRDSVKVLLYSFGIIGDIVYKWTSDGITSANPTLGGYGNDATLWEEPILGLSADTAMRNIPSYYFPTPHFSIRIDSNLSPPNWFQNVDKIIASLETIRPINNVFRSLSLHFRDELNAVYVRMDSYDRVKVIFPINEYIPTWITSADVIIESSSATDVIIESSSATDVYIEDS